MSDSEEVMEYYAALGEPASRTVCGDVAQLKNTITQLRQRIKELEDGQGESVAFDKVFGIIDPDYGRIFTIARLLAWQEGYSICAQGSFTRDLDLLAVPWTEHARKDGEILVKRIAQAAGLTIHGSPSDKPHGRKAWTLLFPTFGDPRFVDLSIFSVPDTSAPRIPDGWQPVPKEPTKEMVDDAVEVWNSYKANTFSAIYKAMLEAAPKGERK